MKIYHPRRIATTGRVLWTDKLCRLLDGEPPSQRLSREQRVSQAQALLKLIQGDQQGIHLRSWPESDGSSTPKVSGFITDPNQLPLLKWAGMAQRAGQGLGYGVVPRTGRNRGPHRATVLWLDVDTYKLGTRQVSETLQQRISAPPSAVVSSGGGLHLLWKLDSPVEPSVAEAANRALAARLPWDLDSTHDATRILRLPGTLNLKHSSPRWCRLLHIDDRPVLKVLGATGVGVPSSRVAVAVASPLPIKVPGSVWDHIEGCADLQGLWRGEGLQLGSPTPSNYDWQIAVRLGRAGFSHDQIASTIRVRRGDEKDEGYFARTATNALAHLNDDAPCSRSEQAPLAAKRRGAACPSESDQ